MSVRPQIPEGDSCSATPYDSQALPDDAFNGSVVAKQDSGAGEGFPVSESPWFKHWAKESLASADLNSLTDHEERVWWRLLSVASIESERWHIRMPREALTRQCASTPAKFKAALQVFVQRGMVRIEEDGALFLINAPKYQVSPDARRKQAERSRTKGVTSHGHVTGHVARNVTGEERRKKKEEEDKSSSPREDDDDGLSPSVRDMCETILSKLGRFQYDPEVREQAELFARDYEGRWHEFQAALNAVRRTPKKLPFPGNLREHMPPVGGPEYQRPPMRDAFADWQNMPPPYPDPLPGVTA